MANDAKEEIEKLVAVALGKYQFRRYTRDHTLVRISAGGDTERLVDGCWIESRRPFDFDNERRWQRLDQNLLFFHVRRYFLTDLDESAIGWKNDFRGRLNRSFPRRWLIPPPQGGSDIRRENLAGIRRTRSSLEKQLERMGGQDGQELKEEAIRSFEFQQALSAGVEQRASFLLGAAGLTTSLVLANAGLLIDNVTLSSPWLQLAAGSLGVASLCAAITGLRAIQATMFDFTQVMPHTTLNRRNNSGDDLVHSYIAQLQIAEFRERAVGQWKKARLASARRWFFGALAGIVLLTMLVLVEVVQQPAGTSPKAQAAKTKPTLPERSTERR